MSIMSSVDIVLTDHKLSDAQKNGVIELLSGGFTTTKANTIKSLVNKGLVIESDGAYTLEESFHAELREAYNQPEPRTQEELVEIEALLEPVGSFGDDLGTQEDHILNDQKSVAEAIYGDPQEPLKIIQVDTFVGDWAEWEMELAGFGSLIAWRNREVWDGLTALEIREDLKTARQINRKARRERGRQRITMTKFITTHVNSLA